MGPPGLYAQMVCAVRSFRMRRTTQVSNFARGDVCARELTPNESEAITIDDVSLLASGAAVLSHLSRDTAGLALHVHCGQE